MEKLILVFYVFVGNTEPNGIPEIMEKVSNLVERDLKYNNAMAYFIPTTKGESRIECINPKLVNEEDYKNAQKVLDESQNKLEQFFEDMQK